MGAHPGALVHKQFHFVVAAPQAQAGVMAQPPHVVPDLLPDVLGKSGGQVVHRAGEHQVLPNQQAQFITGIKEGAAGVAAAAPNPDTIKIGRCTLFQQLAGPFRGDPGEQVVFRDVIRAHGKDLHPVDLMGKAFPPSVLLPGNRHRAQADPTLPGVQNLSV